MGPRLDDNSCVVHRHGGIVHCPELQFAHVRMIIAALLMFVGVLYIIVGSSHIVGTTICPRQDDNSSIVDVRGGIVHQQVLQSAHVGMIIATLSMFVGVLYIVLDPLYIVVGVLYIIQNYNWPTLG